MLCFVTSVVSQICRTKKVKCEILNPWFIYKCFGVSVQSVPEDLNDKRILTAVKNQLTCTNTKFEDGYTCLKINTCSFCSPTSNVLNVKKLFINKKTGDFLCHQCKILGSWTALKNFMNLKNNGLISELIDLKKECRSYDMSDEWKEIVNESKKLCDMNYDNFKLVLKKFGLIPFKKENAKNLNIHLNTKNNLLLFPITDQDTVLGITTLNMSGYNSTFPKTDCAGCLCYSNQKNSAAVVVADIKDFIALISLNLVYDIICLPYGVATLPQSLLPSLEMYDKIILWLGVKAGAWNSSIHFAKKLLEKRCYLIRPTENQISAEKAVLTSQNVKDIIKNAKPIWHQFVTTFSSLREDVLAEIQNLNEICGVKWSRFPKLNKILKGHRRGELTVLTGPTGSGKTTFLSEYSLDLAINGVNTLWGSFEIKNPRLVRTMLQQYADVPLRGDNIDDFNYWADRFENLPIYFLTFHGQHSTKTVMNAVQHCSYVYDIAHVIIDNVQFMIDISNDSNFSDRFWAQDCVMQAFRRFATENNCHVTLVVHPRKETGDVKLNMNSIFGSAKTTQEADNILIIQEAQGTVTKYLQVCKNRFTGNLGSMALIFNKETWRFSQKSHDNSESTGEENFVPDGNIYMKT